jgi:hypothetical protein
MLKKIVSKIHTHQASICLRGSLMCSAVKRGGFDQRCRHTCVYEWGVCDSFFFIYKFSDTLTSRSRFLQPWIWSICFCLPGLQKPKVNLWWANEPLMPEVNCSCANAESEPFMCICRKWTFHDTRLLFLIRSQIRIQGDIQGAFIQRAIYVHTHTQAGISPRKSSLRVCIYRCIEKTILADRKISETEEDNRVGVFTLCLLANNDWMSLGRYSTLA